MPASSGPRRRGLAAAVQVTQRVLGADAVFAYFASGNSIILESIGLDARQFSAIQALAEPLIEAGTSVTLADVRTVEPFKDNPLVAGETPLLALGFAPLNIAAHNLRGGLVVASREVHEFDLGALVGAALVIEFELNQSAGRARQEGRSAGGASKRMHPPSNNQSGVSDTVVLDAVVDGVVVIDSDGSILRHNHAAAAIIASGENDFVGQNISNFVPSGILRELVDHFAQAHTRETPDTRIISLRTSNEGADEVEMSTSALVENGEMHYVAVFREAGPVRPGSAGIASTDRAPKSIDLVLKEQREFLRKLSHEVRSGLTGVSAFSELIRDADLSDSEIREYASDIYFDAQRLARICDDIMIVERTLKPAYVLSRRPVDVVALCQQLVDRRRRIDTEHEVEFESTHETLEAQVDPDQLIQAINNLLDNAAKYSPEGSTITTSLSVDDESLHLSVRDEGIGISPSDAERIFERGFRADAARDQGFPGTGLGLTVVQQIATLHGGRVDVASEIDKGSEFTLTIPLKAP